MWSGWIFGSLDVLFHYLFLRLDYPPQKVMLNDARFDFIWNETDLVVLRKSMNKQFVSFIKDFGISF